jgi:hypothetical protein
LSTATQDNHGVMPGEVHALCGAPSDSGSVLAIVTSPQHGYGGLALVDMGYFVILKSREGVVLIATLSLGENPSDKEELDQR